MAVYFTVEREHYSKKTTSLPNVIDKLWGAHKYIPTKFGSIACEKMVEMWKDYGRVPMTDEKDNIDADSHVEF